MKKNDYLLYNFLMDIDLYLLNDGSPTRITTPDQSTRCQDLAFDTQEFETLTTWQTLFHNRNSDHFPILITIDIPSRSPTAMQTHVYPCFRTRSADWPKFSDFINFRLESQNANYEEIRSLILEAAYHEFYFT